MLKLLMGIRFKLIAGIVGVALIAGFAWHYRSVIADRAMLELQNAAYVQAQSQLQLSLRNERTAAQQAVADRDAAQAALDALRAGRESDPEAQVWGAQSIPSGERGRICAALPGAHGCPSTPDSN